jgi:hypothetical protein
VSGGLKVEVVIDTHKQIGLLTAERDRILAERGISLPPLIIKGCEDHILNLMSQDLEDALVKNSLPHLVVCNKHRATDVVQFIISKVYSFFVCVLCVYVCVCMCGHCVCVVCCMLCVVCCVLCVVCVCVCLTKIY